MSAALPVAFPNGNGYDPLAHLPSMMVMTEARALALTEAYQANGFQPLSDAQITAAVGANPPLLTSLPLNQDTMTPPFGPPLANRYADDVKGGP